MNAVAAARAVADEWTGRMAQVRSRVLTITKQSEYGKVILPLVVLRRLDCVLEPTKDAVTARAKQVEGRVTDRPPLQAVPIL